MHEFRSIGRRRATFRIDLFGSEKSLRLTISRILGSRHPHLSNPRHGGVEGRDRRTPDFAYQQPSEPR